MVAFAVVVRHHGGARRRYPLVAAAGTYRTTRARSNLPGMCPQFVAFQSDDTITATTDDARLRGVVWTWHGGRLVDVALSGHGPADCVSVPYNWRHGVVGVPFTCAALVGVLGDYYQEPVNVAATVDTIAGS